MPGCLFSDHDTRDLEDGDKMPKFRMVDTDGNVVDSTDLRGKPTVIVGLILDYPGYEDAERREYIEDYANASREIGASAHFIMAVSQRSPGNLSDEIQALKEEFDANVRFIDSPDPPLIAVLDSYGFYSTFIFDHAGVLWHASGFIGGLGLTSSVEHLRSADP